MFQSCEVALGGAVARPPNIEPYAANPLPGSFKRSGSRCSFHDNGQCRCEPVVTTNFSSSLWRLSAHTSVALTFALGGPLEELSTVDGLDSFSLPLTSKSIYGTSGIDDFRSSSSPLTSQEAGGLRNRWTPLVTGSHHCS